MPDDHNPAHSEQSTAVVAPDVLKVSVDRSTLLSQARTFLTSPQIIRQSLSAKRQLLIQKGLTESEIDYVLSQLPSLPPRTYPRPPPSNLPVLLAGILRLFSWVAGGSAVLIFIYHRFFLPRIIRSSQARSSLKHHQISLLRSLNDRLTAVQKTQAESLSPLPDRIPYKEPEEFLIHANLSSLREKYTGRLADVPDVTILRCAISGFSKQNEGRMPSADDLLLHIQTQLNWQNSTEAEDRMESLSSALLDSKCFISDSFLPTPLWSYNPPCPPRNDVLDSLSNLSSVMPSQPSDISENIPSPPQRTLQSLTSLTAYISSQVYAPVRYGFPGGAINGSGPEDEIKKEIRALKGLVLNRRNFLPSRPVSRGPQTELSGHKVQN